ncbi:MAG TPA: hypothetical protein VE971_00945 [Candidatus Eisenbacteria bacterium]|nr:hypothetical protein [Candidatus Eisenbacteria bacterium]
MFEQIREIEDAKAYFVFKEVKFNNTPEATVYDNTRNKLGHDTEESTEEQEFIRIFCKKVLLYLWETLKNKK